MNFRGPLSARYPAAVVLVIFALTPYLALSTAFGALTPQLHHDLHLSATALGLTSGMANAAYAFGAVAALQLSMHLPVRVLLVVYAVLFVIASALAAWSPVPGLFVAGRVLQGLCTGLLLIAAVPPLVLGYGRERLPSTALVMNLGLFGAVAVGPVLGNVCAGLHTWRPMMWIVFAIGVGTLIMALLTYQHQSAQDRSAPWDLTAMALAGAGCALAFFGASETTSHAMLSVVVLLPLLAGLVLIAALVVYEYHARNPLFPVRQLATTFPVTGILVAMCTGASSVAVIELTQTALELRHVSPVHAGMLFWPEFGAALVVTVIFSRLFLTRWLPVLVLSGVVLLAGGAAVLTGVSRGSNTLVVVGSGLTGLGVGASVAPALFIAGFSLPSGQIARIFAVVELLRAVAAFLVGPLLLHLALTTGGSPVVGVRTGLWVAFGIAVAGGVLALYVWLLGRGRLQRPRAEDWLDNQGPALRSPPLWSVLRDDAKAARHQRAARAAAEAGLRDRVPAAGAGATPAGAARAG